MNTPDNFAALVPEPPQTQAKTKSWMVIFIDLLSLMLAFFVLMYSMKQIEMESWRTLVEGLSQKLNPSNEWTDPGKLADRTIGRVFVRRAVDLRYLEAVLREKAGRDLILKGMVLQLLDDRLVISLPGDMLFPSGSARLKDDARQAAATLASALNLIGNRVDVVGYTDPEPITNKSRFQSNWDLSLARATSVTRAMISAGYDRPVRTVGRGDGLYYDLSNELSFDERMQYARRVDLIVRRLEAEK